MTRATTRILIVQNSAAAGADLENGLRGLGYAACETAPCGRQAVEAAAGRRPDLALVDLGGAGDFSGIETAEQLRGEFDVPVLYVTDGGDGDLPPRAQASQPCGYLLKPVETRQVDLSIQAALALHEKERRHRESDAALRLTIDELRRKTRIMDTILNSTKEGVVAADATGRILFANSPAERMMGKVEDMKPGDLYHASARQRRRGLFELDKETHVPTDQLPLVRALQGKATDDREMFIRNAQASQGVYVSVTGRTLLSDDHEEVEGGVVFFRDVSKEKEAEADLRQTLGELRDQTHLMETVFESMNEAIFVAAKDGRPIWANARMEQMIGVGISHEKPSEWPNVYGIYYPDRETMIPADQLPTMRALRGERLDGVELFFRNERKPEGICVSVNGRQLLDENHAIQAAVVVLHDITARKLAEAELERTIHDLQTQAQLMETVFESISDGVVVANAEGRFTIFNSSAEHIVGMGMMAATPDQWTHQYGIFHADKETPYAMEELPLVLAMQGEATDDLEMFIRNEKRPEGVFISVNGRPMQNNEEGHGGGVITFRNVTNRKMAETELKQAMQELRDQSELMEATFNGISDGLAVFDIEGKLLNVNPAAKQLANYESMAPSEAELLINWGTYYYPDRQTRIPFEALPLYRSIFHGEVVTETDVFVRNRFRPEGFFARVSTQPLLRADGSIRGGVLIFRDVTDQILAEEALMRAFTQGRLEIIDTLLHNVGNAINSVTIGIGTVQETLNDNQLLRRLRGLADVAKAHQDDWLDYLAQDPQGRKVRRYITLLAEGFARQNDAMAQTVARVGDRAHHVADIIRTQKALDRPHMNQKDIDLEQAIVAAVKVLQESLDKRGVAVEVCCDGAPREIRTQESQFHQMMINLLKNSVEAIDDLAMVDGLAEAPRISVRAYPEGDFLYLDVGDNGIGIDSKNVKLVFAAGYTTKKSGSGLGLHSAANFVIGTGGQIHVLSDGVGKGATLRVMLRLSSICPHRHSQAVYGLEQP